MNEDDESMAETRKKLEQLHEKVKDLNATPDEYRASLKGRMCQLEMLQMPPGAVASPDQWMPVLVHLVNVGITLGVRGGCRITDDKLGIDVRWKVS